MIHGLFALDAESGQKAVRFLGPVFAALAFFVCFPDTFPLASGSCLYLTVPLRETLALTVLVFGWFLLRPVPIWVTALLCPILFPAFGLVPLEASLRAAASEFVLSLFCVFLLAAALSYWKLDKRLALVFFQFFGPDKRSLLFNGIALTGFISMWTSNGLEGALVLPILLAFRDYAEEYFLQTEKDNPKRLIKAMTLGICFAITIGGLSNIVGSPLNISLYSYCHSAYGDHISILSWFIVGLFLFGFGLPFTYFILKRVMVPRRARRNAELLFASFIHEKYRELGHPGRKELLVFGLFAATMFSWTLSSMAELYFGISDLTREFSPEHISMVVLAILLFLRLTEGRIADFVCSPNIGAQPWWCVIWLAGCFSLAYALQSSGAVTITGRLFSELLLSNALLSHIAVLAVMLVFGNFLPTAVLGSLTAVFFSALLMPYDGSCGQMEITLTLLPSAVFFLPLGGVHCLILYSTGFFSFKEFAKYGALIGLVLVPLMVVLPQALKHSEFSHPGENEEEKASVPVSSKTPVIVAKPSAKTTERLKDPAAPLPAVQPRASGDAPLKSSAGQ